MRSLISLGQCNLKGDKHYITFSHFFFPAVAEGPVSDEPMDFLSQVIANQESLNITKGLSYHEGNCQDGPEVFENENNLQTDPDKPEEEVM